MISVINNLKNLHHQRGYLTYDDILDQTDKENINIVNLDSIVSTLLDEGYLLIEKNENDVEIVKEDTTRDRSRVNYSKLYDEILMISPNLKLFIDDIRRISAPKRGEESELIKMVQEGNRYAKERIIRMFLRVAVRQALFYHKKYGFQLDEAVQEGCIGLIIAVEKYDFKSRSRYSRYSPLWVKQNILRHGYGVCDKFYFPVHFKEKLLKLIELIGPDNLECFTECYCDSTTMDNIISETGFSAEEIIRYINYIIPPRSYENLSKDVSFSVCDEYMSENSEILVNTIDLMMFKETLSQCLDNLPVRERQILELRYGMMDGNEHTLEEVGTFFDVTRERIRQIETQALRRLRQPRIQRLLRDFL